ncbi:MAG: DUF2284 domain-containing protein [Eubacteriales bacterium]|nr:DUF2284 domain-containing protein [Eubacteriales bacterium]
MEKYFSLLKNGGADLAIKIDAKTIETAAWTVYRCQFGCSTYGKSHCCPPNAPSWKETQEMLNCYKYGILFRCHEMSIVTPLAVSIARELFLDGFYKVIAFGSGPCKKCQKCNPDHCNFPDQTVPAMEACGIDVFATVRNNGIEIHTLRDKSEIQNHFGLLMVE